MKSRIISIAIIVLLAAGVFYWASSRERIVSKSFVGQIKSATDGKFVLNGFYQIPDDPSKEKVDDRMNVEVLVGSNTKYTKTLLYYPTREDLAASGGMYRPEDLRKEIVSGSVEDLRTGQVDGFYAHSERNVYGKKQFMASEILYIWTVYPEEAVR